MGGHQQLPDEALIRALSCEAWKGLQEAIEQYRQAGSVPGSARRELMEQLITAKAFREAYEVWKGVEKAGPVQV